MMEKDSDSSMFFFYKFSTCQKFIAALGPSGAKAVCAPRIVGWVHVDARPWGNRCCICHRKRRRWGPTSRWFFMVGDRSQGFRPRRRRLSLRRGGIAVVAAVRSDPAAALAVRAVPPARVNGIFVPQRIFISFTLSFPARER